MTPTAVAISLAIPIFVAAASRVGSYRIFQILTALATAAATLTAEERWFPRVGICILGITAVAFIEIHKHRAEQSLRT